jgi:hypothetical protein
MFEVWCRVLEASWIVAGSTVPEFATGEALVLSGADTWMGFEGDWPWILAGRVTFS